MTDEDQNPAFSFLDIFVVVAESWIILVVLPLLCALIAFVVVQNQVVQYRATVDVSVSPAVVREALSAAQRDSGDVRLQVSPGSNVTTIIATSEQSTLPLTVLQGFIDQVQAAKALEEDEAQVRQIGSASTRLAEISNSIERLEAATSRIEGQVPFDASGYAALLNVIERLRDSRQGVEERLVELNATVAAADNSIVVRGPTAVHEVNRRSPVMVALAAALGAGFAMLVLVFARHGFRSAVSTPSGYAKLARIRKAFFLA